MYICIYVCLVCNTDVVFTGDVACVYVGSHAQKKKMLIYIVFSLCRTPEKSSLVFVRIFFLSRRFFFLLLFQYRRKVFFFFPICRTMTFMIIIKKRKKAIQWRKNTRAELSNTTTEQREKKKFLLEAITLAFCFSIFFYLEQRTTRRPTKNNSAK